ncbi:MAG: hypothetical protein ACFCUR_12210 [Rhodomicrobiaceae bacterium]
MNVRLHGWLNCDLHRAIFHAAVKGMDAAGGEVVPLIVKPVRFEGSRTPTERAAVFAIIMQGKRAQRSGKAHERAFHERRIVIELKSLKFV